MVEMLDKLDNYFFIYKQTKHLYNLTLTKTLHLTFSEETKKWILKEK